MQIAWDPWKGCRVGEAKNPGPGASAATSRKRAQKLHPPDSSPESELAQQLMQVLNNFSGKQAQSSHAAESLPPGRKGKGGPVPVKHTSLLHSLYQILQSAVDNQWSDEQIVSRLTTKLSKIGNSTAESDGAQPARQVRFQDEEFPPLRPGPKSFQNTRPDLSARPTRPSKPDAVQSPKGGKPQVSYFADLHRTRNVATSRPTKARFAAKVLDHEWSGDPIVTSIPRILSALKDGKVIPGNLVISGDEQVVEELKQIWSAYDLSDDMTVGIIAPPNSVGPSLSLWWSLDRKRALPYRYKLQLHQLADFEGPTPKPPQLLQLLQTQGPKLVTLRILVPWHCRQGVAGVDKHDAPASVIAELAQLLKEPVAHLTGGKWERVDHPKGQLLIAHLRVPEHLAQKAMKSSGKRAIFSTILSRDRDPVNWELFGTPSFWTQDTVAQFLETEGWKYTTIRTKKRKQGQGVWLFHGFSPHYQTPDEAFWQYSNAAGSCHITIGLEVTRQRKPLPSESLTAPRKRWTHPQASVITLNSDTEEPPTGEAAPSGDSAGKGSHARKKSKTGHDPAEAAQALQVQFPQWSSKDDGGSGDCGFRAVARALACQQGKDLSSDKLVSEASRLRTLTVGHLTAHKDRFSGFWAMDPDARPEQRDHMNEPETFSDYIMAASRKNWWIDGLLLHALAHRLGRVIIIFVWHSQDGAWQRHVVAPTHENGIAKGSKDSVPICLLLSNEHYCSLLPNGPEVNIPQEWLRSTPEVARQVLRGAGKSRSNSSQLSLPASPAPSHSIRQWFKPRGLQEDASSQTAQNSVESSLGLSLPAHTPDKVVQSFASSSGLSLPAGTPSRELSVRADSGLDIPPSPSIGSRKRKQSQAASAKASKVSKLSLAQAYSGVAQASVASVSSKSPRIAAKRPRSWHRTQAGPLSSHVAAQICPAFEGNHKSIPSLATRQRLWEEWNNEARQQVHVPELEARKKRVQLRHQNKIARQAAWDADQKCTPVKQFRGLSVLKADRGDQIWWHCGLCEFTVKYNQPRRSDAKAKHLRDVHGSSNISLNPGKNDALANPARIVKTVEAFQARWQRLHNLIKDGPWPGAHCLNAEAAYYRSYQTSKTGKTWTRAMYVCNKCGMHVCLSDFVTAACKSTGVLPPLQERKERWKALRKQAVQRTKPEPKSRRNHPARGVRIGEAKNPALADPSIAWTLWSQNAEHWLQQSGVLASDKAERALGTVPRVTSGGHRVANMQCVAERQLRRRIRRLDEALVLSHKRSPIPPGLLTHIFQGAVADEKQAVHQRRWGDARAKAKMRRMSVLPCSHAFKASLAALVLSPVVSWGLLLGGRIPSPTEVSNHLTMCRRAVRGSERGHESVDIQQVLLLGHTSDLLCVSFQRAVKALHKWRASSGFPNLVDSSFLTSLSRAAARLGGEVPSLGSFRFGNPTWDTSSPFAFADQCAHGLRDFWRLTAFQRWLCSTRRDAMIARASGFRVTQQLLSQLRACVSSVDGHARQIMCGGLSVEAHRAPLPSSCSCCGHAVVPSTEHILWVCPAWTSALSLAAPAAELAAGACDAAASKFIM
eukprot:Skav215214  [mRNA]  locus=scaffold1252:82926:90141:- [translate_table: standard]